MMTQISLTFWNPVVLNFMDIIEDRPAGGFAVLCRTTYKCTPEKQDSLISFDYSI